MQAGCCTVRTSSGDWQELAENAMRAQQAQQAGSASLALLQEEGTRRSSDAAAPQPDAESRVIDRPALELAVPDAGYSSEFDMLLVNHIPISARNLIRCYASPISGSLCLASLDRRRWDTFMTFF